MPSKVTTAPSPIKGLNSYDGIGSMPEGFAIVMRNFFAQPYGCLVRKGYVQHCQLSGVTETLASHNKGADSRLYAFNGGKLYDVTVANAIPVEKAVGLTNNRWEFTNMGNVAGVSMIAVNGADDPIWFKPDGSISRPDATKITNIDPKKFTDVIAYQRRLWFVEKDTTAAWYLPVEVFEGAATRFDFGGVMNRGGYIMQLMTWTLDDGDGADDHLVAFTSQGEAIVYAGIDPSSPTTWSLKGVYYVGTPMGNRAATRYGGDIAVLTQQGLVFLSELLMSTKVDLQYNNSAKYVQNLISAVTALRLLDKGWQPFVCPVDNMLYLNIPIGNGRFFQFVMNTITKAWSEFVGYNAYCWELHKTRPFFAQEGVICRAWETYTDGTIIPNVGERVKGVPVRAEAQTSFSFFGDLGHIKQYKMVRPTLLGSDAFSVAVAANPDFVFSSPLDPAYFNTTNPSVWDDALWDVATWAGGVQTFKRWVGVKALGNGASLRIVIVSQGETVWANTDWLYEAGGIF